MNQETEEPEAEIPEEPVAIRLTADHLENRIRELQAAIDRDDEPATRMKEASIERIAARLRELARDVENTYLPQKKPSVQYRTVVQGQLLKIGERDGNLVNYPLTYE